MFLRLRMHLLFARALYTLMTPPRHVSIGIDPTQGHWAAAENCSFPVLRGLLLPLIWICAGL